MSNTFFSLVSLFGDIYIKYHKITCVYLCACTCVPACKGGMWQGICFCFHEHVSTSVWKPEVSVESRSSGASHLEVQVCCSGFSEVFIETESYLVHHGFKFMLSRITLNFLSSCLNLSSSGTGRFVTSYPVLYSAGSDLCILGKHSTNWTPYPAFSLGAGNEMCALMLHSKHFTNWAIALA